MTPFYRIIVGFAERTADNSDDRERGKLEDLGVLLSELGKLNPAECRDP